MQDNQNWIQPMSYPYGYQSMMPMMQNLSLTQQSAYPGQVDESGQTSPHFNQTPPLMPSSPPASVTGQLYYYWPPYGMVIIRLFLIDKKVPVPMQNHTSEMPLHSNDHDVTPPSTVNRSTRSIPFTPGNE